VFVTLLDGQTVDRPTDRPGSGPFIYVPNELKLIFADNLGLRDIHALVRTSRALNRLMTPYMYRLAKQLRTRSGRPYFLRAVDTGNLTAVRQFIDVGTSVDMMDTQHLNLSTALHTCVDNRDIATARLLVENGVNLSAENSFGETPLHCAVSRRDANEEMVKFLLDSGADIFAASHYSGRVLNAAAKDGTAFIVQLLLERGAVATYPEPDGTTALHGAASQGSAETVRLLLKAGFDMEATDSWGNTPLHSAVYSRKAKKVEELLQWGANVWATNDVGDTPLHLAVIIGGSDAHYRVRNSAALIEMGSRRCSAACPPLCRRCGEYNDSIVGLLLVAGANIMATNDDNISPLSWATDHTIGA
jgi:ankyrin repeat protein